MTEEVSEHQTTITKANFRKYSDGDILALFPEWEEGQGLCQSFMHIGQHGAADYSLCVRATKPATPEEYQDLKQELESKPYHYSLQPIKRYTRP